MQRQPAFKWLFLDLNSYFASVEQQANPSLRGKPVAVLPSMTDHTCAIAASYEAKAYGVKTGTMIRDAKRMCPGLICVPARHDLYVEYHSRIVAETERHIPVHKIWSIDEFSAILSPSQRTPEKAAALAGRIKQGIWENVGAAINCSIGFAPNTLLAKLGSDMQKPDGLTILSQEDLPGRLFDLKLTDIPGIGVNMERRLNRAGIHTLEQFWHVSPKHARRIWGSVQGERFWYWLHGYDFEPEETKENVMIGHSRVLDPKMRAPEPARLMARRLLAKACIRLRRKGYYASVLSLGVRSTEDERWRHEVHLNTPAHDSFTFLEQLDRLWEQMMLDFSGFGGAGGAMDLFQGVDARFVSGRPALRFKKVSVILTGLRRGEDITGDLLDEKREETSRVLQKREALSAAMDKLQEKYQKETVTLGTPPKTLSGYVGTKIAFSRVPSKEEFWE